MSGRVLVDWSLAEQVANGIARDGAASGEFDQAGLDSACEEARRMVLRYTGMEPASDLPDPELIDRSGWVRLGIGTLREVAEMLERRIAEGISFPGPLGRVARSVAGGAAGVEAGVAVGYGARRVLGQYDIGLFDAARPTRLVFVAPNLAEAQAKLGEAPELFLRWIAIHETTHSVQFASVPWLRGHIAGLIEELIEGASANLDLGSVRRLAGRLMRSDPRKVVRTILQGELARVLAGEEQAQTLDRLQAAMSVIEGHAEHVMDAAAEPRDPGYRRLRERLEARRAARGGLGTVVARLFGLEMKLRQYEIGKAFCDAVVAEAGVEGLNRVWDSPEALPTLPELERPQDWLARQTPAPRAA